MAGKFRIQEKWKKRPKDAFEHRKVRKGYETLGELRKYPSGHIIYWAKRNPDDIYAKSNSWAFDVETINALKAYRVPYIGVLVANGDVYLARAHYSELLLKGKEGTIVKHPKAIWKDGTSKEQVKLKLEADCDLKIVGFEPGNGKNASTFGSIRCRTSDDLLEVCVSGFTDKDRQEINAIREELLESIMTVKANAIMTPSEEGKLYSLFLPRSVEFRRDKHEADSLQRVKDQFEAAVRAV